MPSNRKIVLVPDTMGRAGVALLESREDLDVRAYPTTISQRDLLPLLPDAVGIALAARRIAAPNWTPRPPCRSWHASASATTQWRCPR